MLKSPASQLTKRPPDGCYINGLYLEGARWGFFEHELVESRPKELFTEMPVIWLKPCPNRIKPAEGFYDCPVYKTLMRAGKNIFTLQVTVKIAVILQLEFEILPSF